MEPMVAGAETDTDPRWSSIAARDAAADGRFVYAVTTTGVYCRPSCGSRLAKPENVRFFQDGPEARDGGFRACLRCRPDEAPLSQDHAGRIALACRAIEAAETAPSPERLARIAELSPSHFHRVFKAVTGLTPKGYADAHRARRVREELARPDTNVTEAIYESGFNSSGRFYEAADGVLGMKPTAFRAGGARTEIRFAVGECSLGSILVAQSERGICAILIGDDPDALARNLQDRFPKARLIGQDSGFEALVARVVGLVEAPGIGHDLPLDIRGTAFQERVWRALADIPAGTTSTYAEIAKRIGMPGSVRAVGTACGANAIAVAIPCHRVVRSDGGLSGYRWGVERKRTLLDRERAAR
ncbi:bifunctional DNA-binding transcriptional regulator/O6-methylguanine-DNA methyltransferase Ada [uncultured Enterovirga sp.]|uniref:bifunctional DNA-binding transcriptional regulator/O6-methylguanine-DNA methyltransferase Ada n=1 Tax=uncultured Enterovirga sp. TaxID=2026352 RepID=UPI0035CADFA1